MGPRGNRQRSSSFRTTRGATIYIRGLSVALDLPTRPKRSSCRFGMTRVLQLICLRRLDMEESMSSVCPSCGAEMEFSERSVLLRAGTCPSCAKEVAYVEGTTLSEHLPEPSERSDATPVGAPVRVAAEGPACEECGASLEFRTGRGGRLLAVCTDCEATTVYRAERGSETEEVQGRSTPSAGRGTAEGPRGRPCRKCGAPLRFTTDEEGLLVGECDSCGNRFTLPARPRSDRGRDYRERPRYGGRGSRRPSAGRPFYRDRRTSGYRPNRRDERREPDSDEDRARRRRRRAE